MHYMCSPILLTSNGSIPCTVVFIDGLVYERIERRKNDKTKICSKNFCIIAEFFVLVSMVVSISAFADEGSATASASTYKVKIKENGKEALDGETIKGFELNKYYTFELFEKKQIQMSGLHRKIKYSGMWAEVHMDTFLKPLM